MTTIKPTVGRVVHYYPKPDDPGAHQGLGVQAAIIAAVNEDHTLNLSAFDGFGHQYAVQNVPLIQAHDPKPDNGFACWMPYQIGQAEKTEQLQAELDAGPAPKTKAKPAKANAQEAADV